MTPVAFARFHGNALELRRDPAPGFRPLVFADSVPAAERTVPLHEVERLALYHGWIPPFDRASVVLTMLRDAPHGMTSLDICAAVPCSKTRFLSFIAPLRRVGRIKVWPQKGTGAVWYVPEHEPAVRADWQARQDAAAEREREQARERQRALRAHDWFTTRNEI